MFGLPAQVNEYAPGIRTQNLRLEAGGVADRCDQLIMQSRV